ncbi:MAG TPA: TonB-dependent receptor [Sphingobacterium sp.]|nr:TonB-dependent receptor [Sphingobacterium sp.]
MKHLYFLLVLFVGFLITGPSLHAQQMLSGNILDKTNAKPLQGVTVTLKNLQDSTQLSFVTNASGVFSRSQVRAGNYVISTNSIGYKSEKKTIIIAEKPMHVFFRLEPVELEIEEVEIMAPPSVTLRGDTMEFDARNFSTREFAEADELVAQIPGVMIDEDGNVTAHGEEVTKVIVDGKEFFSTDPQITLKNLPAEIISKIQIIDEKSEQARFSGFDDGKRSKVINIVTKPDRRHGYFGRADAGLGAANKFGLNAKINKFDGDKKMAVNIMANNINETDFREQGRGGGRRGNNNTDRGLSDTYAGAVNFTDTYLDKNIEFNADYKFKSVKTATNSVSNIEYLLPSRANQFRNQDQFSDIGSGEHSFSSRLRWNIDSVHRIDFSPNIRYNSSSRDMATDYITMLAQTEPINSSVRSNSSTDANFNFSGSLTYMFRFKKRGRTISASMSGNKSTNEAAGLNLAVTSYYRDALLSRIDTNNNRSVTDGYGSGFRNRIAFTETISPQSRLQANYNFRNTSSYSNRETYEFLAETGQLGELRDRLSNEFRNDYVYHGAGLSYIYNKHEVMRIQAGLNYEHGIRKNDRQVPYPIYTEADFGSFLPEMTFLYYFSKEKNFEVNYNTETRTPAISQLQDFINNHNELNISSGNPNLKQEYTHRIKAQYKDINKTTGRSLNTNVQMEYINDKIINSILMPARDSLLTPDIILRAGGQYRSPENMDGAYAARLYNSYGLPIKKWKLNLNFNSRLFYNNNFALVNTEKVSDISYGFAQDFGLNTNINKKYIFGLRYSILGTYYENLLAPVPRYNIYIHRLSNNITVELLKKIVVNSSLSYFVNTGLMEASAIKTTYWSASLGYKLFKKQDGEIAIKGFDLLNNAQNISRRVNENTVTDISSNTLNRYFIMSFAYNLRQFGSARNRGALGN